jgi:hypothetical protein
MENALIKMLRRSKRTILLVVFVAATAIAFGSAVVILFDGFSDLHFPSLGTIHTIGVEAYWDSNLQTKAEEFEWGTVWPGATRNITFYVLSQSNIETSLELRTENWVFNNTNSGIILGPSNTTSFMRLELTCNETAIPPGKVAEATLSLIVGDSPEFSKFLVANEVVTFSVDVYVSARESAR